MKPAAKKAKKAKKEDHSCKEFAETKWRINHKDDWEPVYDYCTKCGEVIHEY